jgi:Bacteriophage HK97-gp10, putative tail-component
MGYRGAKLANVFADEPADVAARGIADDAADFMLTAAVEMTPVDTGHLKSSWEKSPTHRFVDHLARRGWETGIETGVSYAPFVEWGTGLWGPKHAKYPIRPKKPDGWLHWVDDAGDDHFAKLVMHPGSKGHHMAALAVAHTDAALGFVGEEGTLLWRDLQEKVWDKEAARARIEVGRA